MDKETKAVIEFVEGFKGKNANKFENTYEYIIYGGWEKDYFADWLESENRSYDYFPSLDEIEYFCKQLNELIEFYLNSYEDME